MRRIPAGRSFVAAAEQAVTRAGDATFELYQRLRGEDHPATLRSATNLARNLHELGEHEQAHQLEEYVRAHSKG